MHHSHKGPVAVVDLVEVGNHWIVEDSLDFVVVHTCSVDIDHSVVGSPFAVAAAAGNLAPASAVDKVVVVAVVVVVAAAVVVVVVDGVVARVPKDMDH